MTTTFPSWTYNDDARKRPNVHPLRAPSGAELSCDAPEDHPWHHGLWFTIKYVNGENFWEEQAPYGVLRHVDVDRDAAADSVRGTVHWIRPDRETVVIVDERSLSNVALGDGAYAIDWSVALTPNVDVVLDRTPFTTWGGYGGLAFRGRGDLVETRFLLPGRETDERLLGERAPWCDLSGRTGGTTAGLLFLDAATNPRHPVPWYGSTRSAVYGEAGWSNFVNAAFLWDEALDVPAGGTLRFSYRVIVHDGVWDEARCAAAWDEWHG